MSIGAFMGATLIGARMHYIKQVMDGLKDDTSKILEFLMPRIPVLELHPFRKEILRILKTRADKEKLGQSDVWKILVRNLKVEISPQTMNNHCKALEEHDLITRNHEEDGRAFVMKLTRLGKSVVILFI